MLNTGAGVLQEKMDAMGPNGRIHIQVRYLPFVPPDVQAEAMKKLEKERQKANAKAQLRRRATVSTLDMRGVLTVNVHRCINLEVSKSLKMLSTYTRSSRAVNDAGAATHLHLHANPYRLQSLVIAIDACPDLVCPTVCMCCAEVPKLRTQRAPSL